MATLAEIIEQIRRFTPEDWARLCDALKRPEMSRLHRDYGGGFIARPIWDINLRMDVSPEMLSAAATLLTDIMENLMRDPAAVEAALAEESRRRNSAAAIRDSIPPRTSAYQAGFQAAQRGVFIGVDATRPQRREPSPEFRRALDAALPYPLPRQRAVAEQISDGLIAAIDEQIRDELVAAVEMQNPGMLVAREEISITISDPPTGEHWEVWVPGYKGIVEKEEPVTLEDLQTSSGYDLDEIGERFEIERREGQTDASYRAVLIRKWYALNNPAPTDPLDRIEERELELYDDYPVKKETPK